MQCGKEISDNVKYCPFCGTNIQSEKAQEGGTREEQMKERVVQEVVFQAAHPVMQETAPKTDVEKSSHKKLKPTMVAASAGIAFIIVIVG